VDESFACEELSGFVEEGSREEVIDCRVERREGLLMMVCGVKVTLLESVCYN
jgi:hypothetical protein